MTSLDEKEQVSRNWVEFLRPLTHTLPGTHTGTQEGAADSLVTPGGDGPAVEGSVFAGPAGFWMAGEASNL